MRILGSIPLSVAKELCSLERVTSNTDARYHSDCSCRCYCPLCRKDELRTKLACDSASGCQVLRSFRDELPSGSRIHILLRGKFFLCLGRFILSKDSKYFESETEAVFLQTACGRCLLFPGEIWALSRILERVAISFSRGSSRPRDGTASLAVIGLPGEEDWPRDVALPRQAFHSKSPQPIEKFVTDIDEQGKDLLLKCLTFNPAKRISAYSALSHPYFHDLERCKENLDSHLPPSQNSSEMNTA
ncbi:hypothetical protein FD754_018015 [Muntiacus muntjak]|uniref:Protein kinase domain-containing protein n=1 Tax=Muntiacus muntjak TaxID=9888 RepID=A0A5N3UWG8_MUNMU|nr:hypothetical protein FD754_018015 [Muntiacus muntjak]